jgi:threonine synthase
MIVPNGATLLSAMIEKVACIQCNRPVAVRESGQWLTCADCGSDDGILDFHYDLAAVKKAWEQEPLADRNLNHWRYRELLPLDPTRIPTHWTVGWTPCVEPTRLAAELGVSRLWLKDDGRNPTASFKDRASSVGLAHAMELGAKTIACASTGNAATSLAGHAALAGMPAVIFVPATAPEPKLAQLLVFGATVVSVQGTYDEAYRLCSAACERFSWYNRNCAINPVLVEGKKTGGLELAEQMHALGVAPDWVSISVGDGCTMAGIWKGLQEMHALGYLEKLPRLLGVQAEGVSPILHALSHDALPDPDGKTTIADSIDVPVPRNWHKAVRAIRQSEGTIVTVSDEQILSAMRLAGKHGVFAEPAAAAAVAGIVQATSDGTIGKQSSVAGFITGSGLKDTKSAIKAGGQPIRIEPDLDELEKAIQA